MGIFSGKTKFLYSRKLPWLFHCSPFPCPGLHRARSARSAGSHSAGEDGLLEPGERVLVAGQRRGVIKFSGETDFAPGM